jgi:hypothetical protein
MGAWLQGASFLLKEFMIFFKGGACPISRQPFRTPGVMLPNPVL